VGSIPIVSTFEKLVDETARVESSAPMTFELTTAMEMFDRCVAQRDRALAEQVLDDDYALILVAPTRAVMPRSRWIEVLDDYHVHSYEVEEQLVAEDDDVAVVLQRVRMDARVLGQDRSGVFVLADTWRKRGGEWRVWRRCSTPSTAGSMPGVDQSSIA
jgi:Domain of unknown function (DUF4440)